MLKEFTVIGLLLCGMMAQEEGDDDHCIDVQLQDDLDITRLEGNWTQIFYTPGSIYDGVDCYHLHVDSINEEDQTIQLAYHFTTKRQPKRLLELIATGSAFNQADVDHRDPLHIHSFARHVASDYTNFFVLYMCDEATGEISIDVQIRNQLTVELKGKINDAIKPLGYTIKALTRVTALRHCKQFA